MKLTILLLTASLSWALPVMFPDSVTVPSTDPRIGQHVYAIPGSNWLIWGNDNKPKAPTNDRDYNDATGKIAFAHDGSGTATWLGSNSVWKNSFVIQGGTLSALHPTTSWGPLTSGAQLNLALVTQYGTVYPSGHVNVMTEQQTPEPATWLMLAAGLALVAVKRK